MILYLIRGLPGVGKSTLARNLLDWKQCFEADMFFVGVIPGTTRIGYQFDASRIKEAHQFCQCEVENAVATSSRDIAVANTFSQRWEMKPYYCLKENYDVNIIEITVQNTMTDEELSQRSIHN